MLIEERLRELRESKNLSQGDIEKRTGMLRCYTSRVENGRTVPSVETLEKYARALEIPVYRLFLDSDGQPLPHDLSFTGTQRYRRIDRLGPRRAFVRVGLGDILAAHAQENDDERAYYVGDQPCSADWQWN